MNQEQSFEYSNPGFNLLELLIEEVTGRDFNEYMENEVVLPLGMYNSSFDWNEEWSSSVTYRANRFLRMFTRTRRLADFFPLLKILRAFDS